MTAMSIDWTKVPARILAMVRWLIENYQRVATMERGKVTFSFAGESLSVELNEVARIE